MGNDASAHQSAETAEEFSSDERPDVIVVGGGIGGLATAVSLRRQGLLVRLYERQSTFGEVGAGMQLATNCTRILQDFGLFDEAVSLGVLSKRMLMTDALDNEEVIALDLERVAERYGSPYMVIHRSDLHGIFFREAKRGEEDWVSGRVALLGNAALHDGPRRSSRGPSRSRTRSQHCDQV